MSWKNRLGVTVWVNDFGWKIDKVLDGVAQDREIEFSKFFEGNLRVFLGYIDEWEWRGEFEWIVCYFTTHFKLEQFDVRHIELVLGVSGMILDFIGVLINIGRSSINGIFFEDHIVRASLLKMAQLLVVVLQSLFRR